MIKSLKSNRILFIILLLFLLIFISSPKTYIQATLNGLTVWFYNVLPALFPFFIASKMLILMNIENIKPLDKITNKLFKVNNAGTIFLLSIISGYPVGAKLSCEAYLNGQTDSKSAKKILSFCSVSGPMFIIGSIGVGVFRSAKVGYILLICHIIGAIINGIIFRNAYKNEEQELHSYQSRKKSANILADSMYDSIISILLVGGYIVFAFVIIEVLKNLNIIPTLSQTLATVFRVPQKEKLINSIGIFEMTCGLINVGQLNLSNSVNICIASFLIGFGGISIFLQSLNFTKELKIKKSFYFFQKLCQGLITLLVSVLICIIFRV